MKFPIVLLLSWTKLQYLCLKYKFFFFGNSGRQQCIIWRQRFRKAPFSCDHIKTYRCVFKCLRIQKRFQVSPFSKTEAPVFDRCSVVARWKRIENDAFSNENALVWFRPKSVRTTLPLLSLETLYNFMIENTFCKECRFPFCLNCHDWDEYPVAPFNLSAFFCSVCIMNFLSSKIIEKGLLQIRWKCSFFVAYPLKISV